MANKKAPATWLRVTVGERAELIPVAGPVCGISDCYVGDDCRTRVTMYNTSEKPSARTLLVKESIAEIHAQLEGEG